MERRFPEILLTDPRIRNQDSPFTTTEENITRVAPLALYYWHCIHGILGESVDYIDESGKQTQAPTGMKGFTPGKTAWKLNDGIHFPGRRWEKYRELSREQVSPTLPFEMPITFKRSRNNDMREFPPVTAQLEGMGIANVRNRAKIIYSLFPQLSHGEIGLLFPASPDTKTSKQTDRDRGRWLLGLKSSRS